MKKLHLLRSQFRKEMKASQKSGARIDEVCIPKLWCLSALAFFGDGDSIIRKLVADGMKR